MARVPPVFHPSDFPPPVDETTAGQLAALFDHMFPGAPDQRLDAAHAGFAVVAQSPKLALNLVKVTGYMAGELGWTQRRDLREIMIQTLNYHFKSVLSFEAHLGYAKDLGVSAEQQAAIHYWRTTSLFDDEQRLVVEYTLAVCAGETPAPLFDAVVKQFGQRGAVEFTAAIAWWSMWAMILNAVAPEA